MRIGSAPDGSTEWIGSTNPPWGASRHSSVGSAAPLASRQLASFASDQSWGRCGCGGTTGSHDPGGRAPSEASMCGQDLPGDFLDAVASRATAAATRAGVHNQCQATRPIKVSAHPAITLAGQGRTEVRVTPKRWPVSKGSMTAWYREGQASRRGDSARGCSEPTHRTTLSRRKPSELRRAFCMSYRDRQPSKGPAARTLVIVSQVFCKHPVVEVRGIEPRSVEPSTPASPSAAISELSVRGR